MDEYFNATQAIDFSYGDSIDDDADDHVSSKVVAVLDIINEVRGCSGSFELKNGENIIGRCASCAVHINSKTLSKQHAAIDISGESFLIYDLGSTNKTRKGKIVLKPEVRYSIENGDLLTFADIECKFSVRKTIETNSDDTASETGSESMFVAESTASDPEIAPKSGQNKDMPTPKNQPPKVSILVEETPAPKRGNCNDILVPESQQANESGLSCDRSTKKALVEDSLEGSLRLSMSFNESGVTNNESTVVENDGSKDTTVAYKSILMQPTQPYIPSSSDTEDEIDEAILNAETQIFEEPPEEKRSKLSLSAKVTQTTNEKTTVLESDDEVTADKTDEDKRMAMLMAATQPYIDPSDEEDSNASKKQQMGNKGDAPNVNQTAVKPTPDSGKVSESDDAEDDDDSTTNNNRMALLMAATQPYVETADAEENAASEIQSNVVSSKTGKNKLSRNKEKPQSSNAKRKKLIEDDSTTDDDIDDEQKRMDLLMAPTQAYVESPDDDENSEAGEAATVDLMAETQAYVESNLQPGAGKATTVDLMAETQAYVEPVPQPAAIASRSKSTGKEPKASSNLKDDDRKRSEIEIDALLMAETQPYVEENEPSTTNPVDTSADKPSSEAQTLSTDEPKRRGRSQKKLTVKADIKEVYGDKLTVSTTPKGKPSLSRKKITVNKTSTPSPAVREEECKSTNVLTCPTQPYPESDSENGSAASIEPTLPFKSLLDDVDEASVSGNKPQNLDTSKVAQSTVCEPTLAYTASLDDVAEEEILASKTGTGMAKRGKGAKRGRPGSSRMTKKKGTIASFLSSSSVDSSQESVKEADGIRLAVDRLLDGPLKSSQEDKEAEKMADTENSLNLGSADTLILSDSPVIPDVEASIIEVEQKSSKMEEVNNAVPEDVPTAGRRLTRGGRKNLKSAGEPVATIVSKDDKPKKGRPKAVKESPSKTPPPVIKDMKNEEESLSASRSRRPRIANKRYADDMFLTDSQEKTSSSPERTIAKGGRRRRKSAKESVSDEAITTTSAATPSSSLVDREEAVAVSKTPRSKLKLANVKGKHMESSDETEAQNSAVPKIVIRREAGQQEDNGIYTVTAVSSPKKQLDKVDNISSTPRSSRKRTAAPESKLGSKEESSDERNELQSSNDVKRSSEASSAQNNARRSLRAGGKSETQAVENQKELDQELHLPNLDSVQIPKTPRGRAAAKSSTETPVAPTSRNKKKNARQSKLPQLPATSSDGTDLESDKEFVSSSEQQTSSKNVEQVVTIRRRGRPSKAAAAASVRKQELDAVSERTSRRSAQKNETNIVSNQISSSATQKSPRIKRGQRKDVVDGGVGISDETIVDSREPKVENGQINEDDEFVEGKSMPKGVLSLGSSRITDSPTKRPSSRSRGETTKRLKKDPLEEDELLSSVRPSRSRSSSISSTETAATVQATPKSSRRKKSATPSSVNKESEMPPPATTPASTSKGRPPRNKRGSSTDSTQSSPAASIATPRKRTKTPEVNSSPNRTPRKSPEKKISIMFTGLEDEKAAAIATRLGGKIVDSVMDCTHLITDKVRRTFKFLCTVARGRPIVSCEWLYQSGKANSFLDPTPYLIHDPASEKQYKFKLSETLKAAQEQPLLEGMALHVTTNVLPEPSQMKLIIQCAGGELISRMPIAKHERKTTVVISCAKDLKRCAKIAGEIPVVSAECILTGVLQHKFDFSAYSLL